MPNILNICYPKNFYLLTLNVRFSQTSLFLVLKVENYFAAKRKTERRYEQEAVTFFLKENKENQRKLFKFMALKLTRRTKAKDKAKVTRSTNELDLPCKSLPCQIKVKNTCSSKFVAQSVPSL